MLVGWLIQSIDPTLRSSVTYFDTVHELWLDLKQRFTVSNGPRKLQLRSQLAGHRQDGQTVTAYYASLKKIWDELRNYSPPRLCICEKCKCKINEFLKAERDEERIHQFLLGLDDTTFGSLRSNVLA